MVERDATATTRVSIRRSELEVEAPKCPRRQPHPFAYAPAHAVNKELANDTLAA
jgi:hypothetical protein